MFTETFVDTSDFFIRENSIYSRVAFFKCISLVQIVLLFNVEENFSVE